MGSISVNDDERMEGKSKELLYSNDRLSSRSFFEMVAGHEACVCGVDKV